MMLLSIIIPFHNSVLKCARLLSSLRSVFDHEVEILCVDDGSWDGTLEMLFDFQKEAPVNVKVLSQENKGPGGARNLGLISSVGEYIWFVDSDDDINLHAALEILRMYKDIEFDFIDFNIMQKGKIISSMNLAAGAHDEDDCLALARQFGRICSKIFRKQVFIETKIKYPEYCIYEDNPLIFMLPLVVKSYFKSEVTAYIHHEDCESITRGDRSKRYFDRMLTARWGFAIGCQSTINPRIIEIFVDHFIRLYLRNTGDISAIPSRGWFEKMRVMRQFRHDVNDLSTDFGLPKITEDYRRLIWNMTVSRKYKMIFFLLYIFSSLLPSQMRYFQENRINAWGRPFVEPEKFIARTK